jgi:hypothetical protein
MRRIERIVIGLIALGIGSSTIAGAVRFAFFDKEDSGAEK